jgi:riboflavin biosynthesis pyrimidine reductase
MATGPRTSTEALECLYDVAGGEFSPLPEELLRVYGGPFALASPVLYANFVQSIDGVVALRSVPSPGSLIGLRSSADRFVVALLRAFADAVLIGAGTLRDAPGHRWVPGAIYPELADAFGELRLRLGGPSEPKLVVLTRSGRLDAGHPALREGALVLTTPAGAERLRPSLDASYTIAVLGEGSGLDVAEAIEFIRSAGYPRVLSEAGPDVTGQLLQQGLLDELFITASPVLVGGDRRDRRAFSGACSIPLSQVGDLVSVRRGGSHLFLRYRRAAAPRGEG